MALIDLNDSPTAIYHGSVSIDALILGAETLWTAGTVQPPVSTVPLRTGLPKTGARQIHSGHSLTDPLFQGAWPYVYLDLVENGGQVDAYNNVRKSTIPGSNTKYRWDNDTSLAAGDRARADIANYALLSITERVPLAMMNTGIIYEDQQLAEDVDYLGRFFANARTNGKGGAGADVLLWTTWASVDNSSGPFRTTTEAWEKGWHYRQEAVNRDNPQGYLHIIPGHRLMMRIYDDVQAGVVPGVSSFTSLFRDSIHPQDGGLLCYAIACLHYAVIYCQSPVGRAAFGGCTAQQATYFQTIAWEIATTYARAGLGGTDMGVSGGIAPVTPPPPDPDPDPEPDTPVVTAGLQNPSVGFNFGGVSDWYSANPFANVVKAARPWMGHSSSGWSPMPEATVNAALNANGWPTSWPAGCHHLLLLMLNDQPNDATKAGTYRVRWKGTPNFQINGGSLITSGTETTVTISAGQNLALDVFGPGMTDLEIVHTRDVPTYDAGDIFNQAFIGKIRNWRTIRFMNWQCINGQGNEGNQIVSWSQRRGPSYYTWAVWQGVPVEVMVALANRIGADPWFCMPHLADDNYITQFATYVRDHLDSRLKAYVEYSNEAWNGIFGQTAWLADQARALWPGAENYWEWMQFYGGKVANMVKLWNAVFGATSERIVRVISSQPGREDFIIKALDAPLWTASNPEGKTPAEYCDVFATTGYIGNGLGTSDYAPELLNVRTASGEAAALTRAFQILQGEVNGSQAKFGAELGRVAPRGLDLVMYEGGSHASAVNDGETNWVENPTLVDLLYKVNRDSRMGPLYTQHLNAWKAAGGKAFCLFTDIEMPTKHGTWGHLESLSDTSPRMTAVMNWNASNPGTAAWLGTRDPNAFYDRAP